MSPATSAAIDAFKALQRAERRVAKLTGTLYGYVAMIPEDEFPEYIAITEEMERAS